MGPLGVYSSLQRSTRHCARPVIWMPIQITGPHQRDTWLIDVFSSSATCGNVKNRGAGGGLEADT